MLNLIPLILSPIALAVVSGCAWISSKNMRAAGIDARSEVVMAVAAAFATLTMAWRLVIELHQGGFL